LAQSLLREKHLPDTPQKTIQNKETAMTSKTYFASRFTAFVSALMLSAIALATTVTVPVAPTAHSLHASGVYGGKAA